MNVDDHQGTSSDEGKNERGGAVAGTAGPTTTPSSSADDIDAKITLAHLVFEYQRILGARDHPSGVPASENAGSTSAESVKKQLMDIITNGSMASFYTYVCKTLGWEVDGALKAKLEAETVKELERLDEAIKKAEEEEGDVEVKDMVVKKAVYLANVGDVEAAKAAFGGGGKQDGRQRAEDGSVLRAAPYVLLRERLAFLQDAVGCCMGFVQQGR